MLKKQIAPAEAKFGVMVSWHRPLRKGREISEVAMSQQAVGMIQVIGYPAALDVADILVKAAQVQLVSCEGIGSGYWTVVIRGAVAEVNAAVRAARSHALHPILSHQVIAQPQANLEQVLPIRSPHASLDDFLL